MNLARKSIKELRKALEDGSITSVEIVLASLERIAEIDSCENGLNSVAEINPEAVFIAKKLDEERAAGRVRGAMHGIPVMLKDNINTGDRMHTTAGSLALKGNFAPEDAGLVNNLRKAGAIILGKVNLTEFANFMTKGMRSGYSSKGGQVLCPYNRSVDPSGSSTGSAVAVAAGIVPASVGTETSGSIICPAMRNGVVGIKPTKGLVPDDGIIPIAPTLDTPGPMGRSVIDAAAMLEAMSDKDGEFTKGIRSSSLKGLRIGVNWAHRDIMNDARIKSAEEMVRKLNEAGAVVIEDINLGFRKELWHVMFHEFKGALNYYLSDMKEGLEIKSTKDIVDFNKSNRDRCLKYGQKYLLDTLYYSSGNMTEPDYLKAICVRQEVIKLLDDTFDSQKLDIMFFANEYNNLAAYGGFPAMTIPKGVDTEGVPTGVYIMARRYDEKRLIRSGYAIEKMLNVELRPPLD